MSESWNPAEITPSEINGGYQYDENLPVLMQIDLYNKIINAILKASSDAATSLTKVGSLYAITLEDGGTVSAEVTTDASGNLKLTLKNIKGDTGQTGATGAPGTNGKEIELRVNGGYIQWKYTVDSTWINLIALSDIYIVDSELSTTSSNPVANSVVSAAINDRYTKTETDAQISNAIGQVLQGSY